MRVVTLDGTRCSFAAALLTPPCSTTDLQMGSAARSMFSFRERSVPNYSLFMQARSTQTAPMPTAWPVALAGLAALAAAMGIGRFAFTPILPLMQDDYGLSL